MSPIPCTERGFVTETDEWVHDMTVTIQLFDGLCRNNATPNLLSISDNDLSDNDGGKCEKKNTITMSTDNLIQAMYLILDFQMDCYLAKRDKETLNLVPGRRDSPQNLIMFNKPHFQTKRQQIRQVLIDCWEQQVRPQWKALLHDNQNQPPHTLLQLLQQCQKHEHVTERAAIAEWQFLNGTLHEGYYLQGRYHQRRLEAQMAQQRLERTLRINRNAIALAEQDRAQRQSELDGQCWWPAWLPIRNAEADRLRSSIEGLARAIQVLLDHEAKLQREMTTLGLALEGMREYYLSSMKRIKFQLAEEDVA